ncbi:MAG: hypothetical protein LH478_08880, partial [Chitinophagaceae bacterium]|nr:hypothetical protein [Chitinophagaceae bacterium]
MKLKSKRQPLKPRIPLNHKPADISDVEWQSALRKQIAEDEQFTIKKTGHGVVFTNYNVYSQHSKNSYKVALRSADNTLNFCSC